MPESATALTRKRKLEKEAEKAAKEARKSAKAAKRKAKGDDGQGARKKRRLRDTASLPVLGVKVVDSSSFGGGQS